MYKISRPGIDRSIASASGATRDGQPLSYNRAPSGDLAPWVARCYVTIVDAPANHHLSCGLFNDTACLRIQLRGKWTAQTADGVEQMEQAALYFGPHSRRMPISVTGSFISVGASLRPGAAHALGGAATSEHVDRLTPIEALGLFSERWLRLFDPAADAESWIQAMEHELRRQFVRRGAAEPDPFVGKLEAAAFVDPTISVKRFADEAGIEQRRLERLVKRDFGLTPKQVLRRARALDMASHLRGVADREEAESLALRYYDQSHLIRDFGALFGMSPRQFVERSQPLLTLGLETRQSCRLEMLERLAPGDIRPWQ
ncbi:helix-turn-helix domain-containing protein [Novosphingobium sp. FKTRR1]|uniref:AraC family transcriptional regulator n=1 Tax=Novosphingobium sp. FKTRR1 TaxID=2879118 RepID=UPI001CF0C340|nr:helix-turn-helix domain-containing protein [Novosphingobium sp. FKTRR1]